MAKHGGIGSLVTAVGVIGGSLFMMGGCNAAFNNRHVETEAYSMRSRATGLFGHREFTHYADGSMDVKVYPGLATGCSAQSSTRTSTATALLTGSA